MCLRTKISCVRREIKVSETVFRLFCPKKIESPQKQYTSLPLAMWKYCCLPGKLGKQIKFVTFFVYTIDEISVFFSNFEPGAQSKLAHAYYVFRSEVVIMSRDCSSRKDSSQQLPRFNRKQLEKCSFEKRQPYQLKPVAVEMVDPNRTRPLTVTACCSCFR